MNISVYKADNKGQDHEFYTETDCARYGALEKKLCVAQNAKRNEHNGQRGKDTEFNTGKHDLYCHEKESNKGQDNRD